MQSFDVSESLHPREITQKDGFTPDNNLGLPLELLREGRNLRADQNFQLPSECRAACPALPEMTLTSPKVGGASEAYDLEKASWGGDVYNWGKRLFQEIKDAGYKIERGIENINPQDLLDLAKDLAVVAAKFGPAISSDVSRVIAAKGLDPVADAKLVIDLAIFAKSPEAARLSEDAKKVLDEFEAKYKVS